MEKVLDRMRNLCSRREYCRADIMKKAMSALDGDREKAEKVIEILVAEKYIDELRYASAFARDKSAISGWGETKIRYMLSSKGVPREIIDKALEEIDESKAMTRLEKLMENKYRSLKDDPQCRLKMLRFGLGRGYGYDEVSEVLEFLMKK
ncbi:MAG: RecX family transcriptional regulator [Bacteroidales bacterium]|nr:RecX family transcriptional regulator [Bacteroidales bacterium]